MHIASLELIDHAVSSMFLNTGDRPIGFVRSALELARDQFDGATPVSTVLACCLSGAALRAPLAEETLAAFWAAIEAEVVREQVRRSKHYADSLMDDGDADSFGF